MTDCHVPCLFHASFRVPGACFVPRHKVGEVEPRTTGQKSLNIVTVTYFKHAHRALNIVIVTLARYLTFMCRSMRPA